MTEQQLQGLGPALARYLGRFAGCGRYAPTVAHLGTYVLGLLSDLPRKSVEPIALAAGTPVRTPRSSSRMFSAGTWVARVSGTWV